MDRDDVLFYVVAWMSRKMRKNECEEEKQERNM